MRGCALRGGGQGGAGPVGHLRELAGDIQPTSRTMDGTSNPQQADGTEQAEPRSETSTEEAQSEQRRAVNPHKNCWGFGVAGGFDAWRVSRSEHRFGRDVDGVQCDGLEGRALGGAGALGWDGGGGEGEALGEFSHGTLGYVPQESVEVTTIGFGTCKLVCKLHTQQDLSMRRGGAVDSLLYLMFLCPVEEAGGQRRTHRALKFWLPDNTA